MSGKKTDQTREIKLTVQLSTQKRDAFLVKLKILDAVLSCNTDGTSSNDSLVKFMGCFDGSVAQIFCSWESCV